MYSIGGFFTLITLFIIFVWYHFIFAPKTGAAIAADKGRSYKKWNFNIWAFGIFAVIYLYLTLEDMNRKEKRSLFELVLGYILIFAAAICFDLTFQFKR